MTEFFEPISLGARCETKYQISRILNDRLWPERSEMTFRYAITRRPRDIGFSRWRLFDWLGATLQAVCDYLERDFEGVFELEDFVGTELGAENLRFQTNHAHDFVPGEGRKVPAAREIVDQYPQARREFEERAEEFRALLCQPGPYLYVVVDPDDVQEQVPRLIRLLGRNPAHRFHILLVGLDGVTPDFPDFGEKVSRGVRKDSSKPAAFAWEGDDESWNDLLAPYALGRHPLSSELPPAPGLEEAPETDVWAATLIADKQVVWRGGAEAAFCYLFWRDQGATLDRQEDGARLKTIPRAWTYSACVRLDVSQRDFARQRVWARITLTDVRGHLMVAAYDPEKDHLSDEMLVGAGPGPSVLDVELTSPAQTQLMLRTGEPDEAAEATIVDVVIVAAEPVAAG